MEGLGRWHVKFVFIIANKIDLSEQREFCNERVEEYIDEIKKQMPRFSDCQIIFQNQTVSCKTNQYVKTVFDDCIIKYIQSQTHIVQICDRCQLFKMKPKDKYCSTFT